MAEYGGCGTSDDLLYISAQKTGTRFEVVSSNEDLGCVMGSMAGRGEGQFATVEREFERGVLGITFRLRHPAEWEPPFVSVIDARGERRRRAWFTKWHELGHLLILSDRSREGFRRTHISNGVRAPEEVLVDRIAGACGFHPVLVRPFAGGTLTFDKVESIRRQLCPEASIQASRIGIVNAWPSPCLVIVCRIAPSRAQQSGDKELALRAVEVTANDAARMTGLALFTNFRVPQRSVITRAFEGRKTTPAIENMNWWAAAGTPLSEGPVLVSAEAGPDGSVCASLATFP
jgi:hypothetical protein